jgi:hypothetical protein
VSVTALEEALPQDYLVEGADSRALLRVFLFSIFALVFGGILIWWSGREREIRKQER